MSLLFTRCPNTNRGFFKSKFRLIRDSGLKIFAFDELDEAAEQAVQASKA